jgi:hypothetical protein
VGGTVWWVYDVGFAIGLSSGEIAWVETPEFRSLKLKPGQVVWCYWVKETRQVTAIFLKSECPKKSKIPKPQPIEVEDKNYRCS